MHKNNFDFLRLIFALFVVVTHAWPISALRESDFLDLLTHHQLCFSYIGVRGFFIISGYLIFQSLQRSHGLLDYFWKRMLRLWPGLLVFSALVVLLGPLVYDASIGGSYWTNPSVWSYIPRNAALYIFQGEIKGIFTENPYPKIINGSLWTICHEFTCYMGLASLYFLRRWPNVMKGALVVIWLSLFLAHGRWYESLYGTYYFLDLGQLLELSTFFAGGAVLAAFRYERNPYLGWTALAAALVLTISVIMGQFLSGVHFILLPIVVIGLGMKATPYLRDIGTRVGDMSYGIYIYGFPVAQVLMYFFGFDCGTLMVTSLLGSLAMGYLSWHLVEKPALRLKRWNPSDWVRAKLGGPHV